MRAVLLAAVDSDEMTGGLASGQNGEVGGLAAGDARRERMVRGWGLRAEGQFSTRLPVSVLLPSHLQTRHSVWQGRLIHAAPHGCRYVQIVPPLQGAAAACVCVSSSPSLTEASHTVVELDGDGRGPGPATGMDENVVPRDIRRPVDAWRPSRGWMALNDLPRYLWGSPQPSLERGGRMCRARVTHCLNSSGRRQRHHGP
jgi:hypothetical protein